MVDNDPKDKLDSSEYKTEMDKFKRCFTNSPPAPGYCAVVKEMIESINTKVDDRVAFTTDELQFGPNYDRFMVYLKEIKVSSMWPRYIAGEINLEEFLSKMSKAREEYFKFKHAVEPLCTRVSGKRLSEEEERNLERNRQAFTYLDNSFEPALESARSQIFDLLKKESITTKLERTEAAVNVLAQNIDSIKPAGEGQKLLADLASKLNCLTRYTVGPAQDMNPPGPIIPYQTKR